MSKISALAAAFGDLYESFDSPAQDRWLSLVPRSAPDIGEARARDILEGPRPSELRIPQDAPAIF
jgi:hypothetical protein